MAAKNQSVLLRSLEKWSTTVTAGITVVPSHDTFYRNVHAYADHIQIISFLLVLLGSAHVLVF